MKVEVWECEDSITVVVEGNVDKKLIINDDSAILIRTIEGIDWNDCMKQHHELMGWEPYKPFPF